MIIKSEGHKQQNFYEDSSHNCSLWQNISTNTNEYTPIHNAWYDVDEWVV